MMRTRWNKSSRVLVKNRFGHPGLTLTHPAASTSVELDQEDAAVWLEWPSHVSPGLFKAGKQLATRRLMAPAHATEELCSSPDIDSLIPRPTQPYTRWYFENSDLAIVHNSSLRMEKNPLFVMSPFGSMIWRMLCDGRPLGEIRREAFRIFGQDEVLEFVEHLVRIGLIHTPGAALLPSSTRSAYLTWEFSPPKVQSLLKYAKVPWYCLWELNTACDLRCQICYLPHFKSAGVSSTQAQGIAQQLVKAGVFYVCLLGGEVLLRKDLEHIIQTLRQAGIFVKLITNGNKLSRTRLQSLVDVGLNMVEISLDGLSEATHDGSRGVGAFVRAQAAFRVLAESAVPRRALVWTAHSGNWHEAGRLAQFMDTLDVRECYISRFKKTGLNGSKSAYVPMLPEQANTVLRAIDDARRSHPHLTITLMPTCSCGRTSAVIGHDGEVRTCSFSYNRGLGNVLEVPFAHIWREAEPSLPSSGPVGYCRSGPLVGLSGGKRPGHSHNRY